MAREKSEKEIELEDAAAEAIAGDEQLKDLKEEGMMYGDIESYSKSAGGKKLVTSLENDVLESVLELTIKYPTATHIELVALCAALENRMDLLRRMTQASKKKDEAIAAFNERIKKIVGGE